MLTAENLKLCLGEASGDVSVALRYIQEKELLLVRVVSAAGLGTRQVCLCTRSHLGFTFIQRENKDAI